MLLVFTLFHVLLSLIGICSGFVVINGLLHSRDLDRWTGTFLVTTTATSVTGFLFPVEHLMPSHILGAISLVVLGLAIAGRYRFHRTGHWVRTYVIGAVVAEYLNVFVLIVQLFAKVPALHELAPTGSEPPFAAVQLATLFTFVWLGVRATMRFRPATAR